MKARKRFIRCVRRAIRLWYATNPSGGDFADAAFRFSVPAAGAARRGRILSARADSLRSHALEQEGARGARARERAHHRAADGASAQGFPQYWKRNTLVVDLQSASGTGGITLKPAEGGKFPVRVAFRVMPGSIGLLEVQADQRMLLPVTREGAKPVDLELVPGVYTAKTPQITVKWEPAK